MDHNWVSTNVYSEMPPGIVHAGHDSDGHPIYVGRAYHEGDLLPAKIIPSKQSAYVSHTGNELKKHDIDVLCGEHYSWVHSGGGDVPPTAIRCGQTTDGEQLFVGRGHWEGSLTPGKIHPSHGCLYIPYAGTEIRLDSYEVLVLPEIWLSSSVDATPPGAVTAGYDSDGSPIYVGRAYHDGDLLPAKVVPSHGCAYVSHSSQEIKKFDYDTLVGYGYSWVHSSGGHVPPNTVAAGRTADGETLFIGRGHWEGSLTPGKIHPSHGVLYIPYGGSEISVPVYEALIKI